MTIQFDKGVPIPPLKGRKPKQQWRDFHLGEMKVGDSFPEPLTSPVRAAIQSFKLMYRDVDYTTRTYDGDPDVDPVTKLPGIRVWRTK